MTFHDQFSLWSVDGDTLDPFVIMDGIRQYGVNFLYTWRYTQDNWVFSLLPGVAALTVLGFHPSLVVLSGWLIYIGSGILLTVLARLMIGRPGYLIAIIYLFCDREARGWTGFLSSPVSHDVTLLWGLAALLCAWFAIARHGGFAVLSAVLVTLASLSDPWGQAAVAGPVAGGAFLVFLLKKEVRRRAAWLCAMMVLSVVVTGTRCFGFLDWLPQTAFQLGTWAGFNANLATWFKGTARILNIIPGYTGTSLATTLGVWSVFLFVLSAVLPFLWRARQSISGAQWLVVGSMMLSCLCTSVLYVIGALPDTMNAARFFAVLVLFVPFLILFCLVQGRSWEGGFAKFASVAVLFLLPVSGLCSVPAQTWLRPVRVYMNGSDGFIDFLKSHDLVYGYGPYWGTNPPGVTWLSRGSVIMRPVQFDGAGSMRQRGAQVSPLWYDGDVSTRGRRFFVALVQDEENCSSLSLCRDALQKHFGTPAERLQYGAIQVLVWDQPAPRIE
ncbi:hypothetical protein [Acetobacter fallax]|uniref:Glycosyltransferase RgtA/B/C/D-like domain-containing protein n=1 Tax=Acetobacter fallax TaxID=1737473 RepID=A0ABX0K5N7_9PROT|nr:hypothetical protein [Acetobacter fallax]NHO31702.1 hypothetical protein [Acetobacter fallax]